MNKQLKNFSIGLTLPILTMLTASTAFGERINIDNSNCGIISGRLMGGVDSLGPWDYTNPDTHVNLPRVEGSYFPPHVENLSTNPTQDAISAAKTLRIYPNHHRALYTVMRYYREYPNLDSSNKLYTMECLFKRANFFAPKDPMVYMLNGMYYHWNSDFAGSKTKYLQAYELDPENPQVNYNLGLMYYDQGDYESSAKHAEIAYDGGYPLQGLRKKLNKLAMKETAPSDVEAAPMEQPEEAEEAATGTVDEAAPEQAVDAQ